MNKRDELYLLYKFSAGPGSESASGNASYRVVYLFNLNGFVEPSELDKAGINIEDNNSELVFTSKDELAHFAKEFIEKNSYSLVYLLSANDFNIGIESCHDLPSLREVFRKYGICIENTKGTSGSILGKFF